MTTELKKKAFWTQITEHRAYHGNFKLLRKFATIFPQYKLSFGALTSLFAKTAADGCYKSDSTRRPCPQKNSHEATPFSWRSFLTFPFLAQRMGVELKTWAPHSLSTEHSKKVALQVLCGCLQFAWLTWLKAGAAFFVSSVSRSAVWVPRKSERAAGKKERKRSELSFFKLVFALSPTFPTIRERGTG